MPVTQLHHLEITKVSVGLMDNNAYLLRCRRSGEAVLIDAANEAATLRSLVANSGVRYIVTTHRHPDHWQALAALAEATGALTVAHPLDAPAIGAPIDLLCGDGDVLTFGNPDLGGPARGGIKLEVIQLRGHTPGSIALLYTDPVGPPQLWTGDSLFPGGVGNTHGNAEDFADLIFDVSTKLFDRLPDQTRVYPGHGADTTLGAERASLPQWRARGW